MYKLIFVFCLFYSQTWAQLTTEIKGRIISRNGLPVEGANIFFRGSEKEDLVTDECGEFTLTIYTKSDSLIGIWGAKNLHPHSPRWIPLLFNLNGIKEKDSEKFIIFKLPYKEYGRSIKKCPDDNLNKKIFRLKKSDRKLKGY
ncbi:MAG: hypothetical protein O9262_08100 [Cyclobacteriaceae bacterium]|nr:hypothetical protein [Cyclobacteriaceae bacterium]